MEDTDLWRRMHSRTPSELTRRTPLIAAIGALAYTIEGVIALRSPQPDQHWHAAGYAIEIAFGFALLATIPLLPLLSPPPTHRVRIATRIAQIGSSAMLIDAIASTTAGRNVLGPVFFVGLLGTLGGLVVMTISQIRTRLGTWWLCPVVLVGLLAGMALGDHGGGILIGISWATVAIRLRIDAHARTGTPSGRAAVVSAAVAALALALIGAGTASAADGSTLPVVRVTLDGRSISAPRTVPSGAVSIVSTVTGQAHDRTVSLVRLQPGATFASAFARVAAHRGNPDYLLGHASIVFDIQANRGRSSADVVLTPGNYVALDSTSGNPSTWPRTPFTVVASAREALLPPAAATVNMIDFAYRGASTLHEGELVRYENTGFVSHMAFGIKVRDIASANRVTSALRAGNDKAAFKLAQAEYAFAGVLSPGKVQEQHVATPPGIYVLACFMASQDGSEHTKLGMIKTIDVVKS
jgi:hypothetical protein